MSTTTNDTMHAISEMMEQRAIFCADIAMRAVEASARVDCDIPTHRYINDTAEYVRITRRTMEHSCDACRIILAGDIVESVTELVAYLCGIHEFATTENHAIAQYLTNLSDAVKRDTASAYHAEPDALGRVMFATCC